jgi:hypothetical protein
MLAQLVRPLVRTQIQLLTQAQSAGSRLVVMVSQWLGYLGVQADVTHLQADGDQIHVALKVRKPELCSEDEWRTILKNLQQGGSNQPQAVELTYDKMSSAQQSKVHRLLANVIRSGDPQAIEDWDKFLHDQLVALGMAEPMLMGIRSALKIPTDIDSLADDLDPEIASFVLSKAIAIALLDRQITQDENNTLKTLYRALERQAVV